MQLYILHFSTGSEKLEVYTSEQQRDARWESFYDEEWPEHQMDIHRYEAISLEGYHDICEHIGENPEYSLWFIDGDIVDYKDIHDHPGLWSGNPYEKYSHEERVALLKMLKLVQELGPDFHEYILDALENDRIDTYLNITKSQITKRSIK